MWCDVDIHVMWCECVRALDGLHSIMVTMTKRWNVQFQCIAIDDESVRNHKSDFVFLFLFHWLKCPILAGSLYSNGDGHPQYGMDEWTNTMNGERWTVARQKRNKIRINFISNTLPVSVSDRNRSISTIQFPSNPFSIIHSAHAQCTHTHTMRNCVASAEAAATNRNGNQLNEITKRIV